MGDGWISEHEADRIKAELAMQLVAASTGVSQARMTQRARLSGAACQARRLAMYLAYVTFGWPVDRVGLAFGLNRSTAAYACRWGEEVRDRPSFDDLLTGLEDCLRCVVDRPQHRLPA